MEYDGIVETIDSWCKNNKITNNSYSQFEYYGMSYKIK